MSEEHDSFIYFYKINFFYDIINTGESIAIVYISRKLWHNFSFWIKYGDICGHSIDWMFSE